MHTKHTTRNDDRDVKVKNRQNQVTEIDFIPAGIVGREVRRFKKKITTKLNPI